MYDVGKVKTDFQGIANFPNVVGVVDCTQLQIKASHLNEDAYVNIMGYHSINTQVKNSYIHLFLIHIEA